VPPPVILLRKADLPLIGGDGDARPYISKRTSQRLSE
jgi:hypothetical protein